MNKLQYWIELNCVKLIYKNKTWLLGSEFNNVQFWDYTEVSVSKLVQI